VTRNAFARYGVALALAALALFLRRALPLQEGTAIYQLPIVAVILSAWYGGRGPGVLASLLCAAGVLYWLIPPVDSFVLTPEFELAFFLFLGICALLVESAAARWRVERALQESERRFRLMAETIPEVLWTATAAPARVLYVSPRYEEIWGRPGGELLRDPQAWIAAVDPKQREETRAAWVRWLAGEAGERLDLSFRILRPDGEARWVHHRATLVRDARGRPERASGIAADVTEEKRSQEALAEARTELAHVARLTTLGELTASIAHEVNQPLGAMVANAAACQSWLDARPAETARARRTLDRIVADGRRAGEVIARIRALVERQPPRRAAVAVNDVIADALALAQQQLRTSGVQLATRLAPDLPPVLGDRIQLQQVMLNLIVNAVDAMAAVRDRPRELAIASRADGAQAVLVEVGDSGQGLQAEGATHLFEAFYTTKEDGLGMGLSISRSIVEAHGGRLWAAPNAPHGAVFRFSLPVDGGEGA
jgi:PAS domain S-box-containing protein